MSRGMSVYETEPPLSIGGSVFKDGLWAVVAALSALADAWDCAG